ncbi:hypothetical protein AJ80_07009 [Polytolypa hystricis UAMH7299]|uniref:Dimethylhistidine N-methyltransferase n=1 Tax=Polytolypa hystricis (strain UAMH7299) TaxID=1447883 RepID=A0A2B7XT30_POLH7|nr:hypothetical protein AJ80_07009 [Polytolypa hystricis UAMH7299]
MAPAQSLGEVAIVDIRRNDLNTSLAKDIYKGLNPQNGGEKTLPTMLLYDTVGLRLFEDITYLDEYYLTNAEIEALTANAAKIVERFPDNCQLVELGSGNLRKVEILLNEFERAGKRVEYLALDLSLEELSRTFAEIPSMTYHYVKCYGLHGTYDDALAWLMEPENRQKPTCILSMGSSIGNFTRHEAAEFLNGFAKILGPSDSMLIGLDSCKDPKKVFRAYNDSKGTTREFYLNGLSNANSILGFDAFKAGDWEAIGVYDEVEGCHRAFYSPKKDISFNGINLNKGEGIFFEQAYKYGPEEREQLWRESGLAPAAKFGNITGDYYLHLLSPSTFGLPERAEGYAANPTPSLQDFQSLWKAWDAVTMSMVPREELLSKPINLRNALIFYLGHVPTFIDIHITRATNGQPTEPKDYPLIFERGIDPDVDNPELCHAHSEIPDEWPPLDEILNFRDAVRNRIRSLLAGDIKDRRLAEALWLGFEHEAMHLETFLYMLLQSDSLFPPPGVSKPDFEALAQESNRKAVANEWFVIPDQELSIGLDDTDINLIPAQSFGWDNEKPQRKVKVSSFSAQGRPITNGEYSKYLEANDISAVPASWVSVKSASHATNGIKANGHTNGDGHTSNGHGHTETVSARKAFTERYAVRTVFGPVLLEWALDWPVLASYNELEGYAKWMNCRIPTYEEVKSIYNYVASLKGNQANGVDSNTNGIQNDPPNSCPPDNKVLGRSRCTDHQPVQPPSLDHQPVYIDLDGNNCNVGFKRWHPTPVTHTGNRLSGQAEFGGVWEWTSSPLKPHEGFKAMELYPGYTADFFDRKHNIVLGGSWATHPRIAGRTTFVNWYQRNYPYAWVGARLAQDI